MLLHATGVAEMSMLRKLFRPAKSARNVATTGRYLHADKARALKAGNVASIAIDRGHRRRAGATRP